MNLSVGMPFSGGQDSIMNLVLQLRDSSAPVHLFYFDMGTPVAKVELDGIKSIVPRIRDDLSAPDVRLHIVDAFRLEGISQEPNPFLPFRNAFFGQYIMGLGFKKILYSFSAEDCLFYDTSDEFMADMRFFAKKNLNSDVQVYTLTREMTRIGYMRYIIDNYGWNSRLFYMMEGSHSCASPVPCNACLCCLERDLAYMWTRERDPSLDNSLVKKTFIKRWKGHTTLRDFYRRVMTGNFYTETARDEYWKFLEGFEKGALLKGLAI